MNKVLIFGHKNPDTDTVCAAITLSNLKNELGYKTEPRILGAINEETAYVLKKFEVKTPRYLNDVKLQIKDVNYRKKYYVNNKKSILDAFNFMSKNDISTIPVVDDKKKFSKSLAMKDIARNQISNDSKKISASYENILKSINGTKILKFDDELKGNIVTATFNNKNLTNEDILIVENNYQAIESALKSKVKLIIITENQEIKSKYLKLAEKNKINIIKTPLDSFNTSIKIVFSNYIKDLEYTKDLLCIDENDYVNDVLALTKQTKFSYYPIVNKEDICLGLLKVADLNDKHPKKVILVDHNEYQQSVDGIEEAEILEIIDHHKIGSLGTKMPINFRTMPVGSTNTIIYYMYKENNIKINVQMASLMLSGIISDTLMLNSPTTTELDKIAVKDLEKISKLNHQKYGIEMLKAGTNLETKTKEQILYSDFKIYEENNKKIGIGICQAFTEEINIILDKKDEYIEMLNEIAKHEKYDIITLFITDIIGNGSYILYNNDSKKILNRCFKKDLYQGMFLDKFVSRKKQIVPAIINEIDNK